MWSVLGWVGLLGEYICGCIDVNGRLLSDSRLASSLCEELRVRICC